ncbi:hypothetical protein SynROS8604_02416 [Synechococcus sp. ROS8604]|nr:hypothetical protein SynROS8604_02416 [Synechococcus sp. ROS8604]
MHFCIFYLISLVSPLSCANSLKWWPGSGDGFILYFLLAPGTEFVAQRLVPDSSC